jgi:hypothetical protein
MTKSRKDLISYVSHRSLNIIRDTNTFLWMRSLDSKPPGLDKRFENATGYGNILVGAGLFLTLAYLSSIFWTLEGKNQLDHDSLTKVKEALAYLKTNPTHKEAASLLKVGRMGDINETEAFVSFIKAFNENLLGLCSDDELGKVYRIARHKSIHMIAAGGEGDKTVTMRWWTNDKPRDYLNIQHHLARQDLPSIVLQPEGYYHCYLDLLNHDLRKIRKKMVNQLKEPSIYCDNRVESALTWIRQKLSE